MQTRRHCRDATTSTDTPGICRTLTAETPQGSVEIKHRHPLSSRTVGASFLLEWEYGLRRCYSGCPEGLISFDLNHKALTETIVVVSISRTLCIKRNRFPFKRRGNYYYDIAF